MIRAWWRMVQRSEGLKEWVGGLGGLQKASEEKW